MNLTGNAKGSFAFGRFFGKKVTSGRFSKGDLAGTGDLKSFFRP
jgi:hypothetical protein